MPLNAELHVASGDEPQELSDTDLFVAPRRKLRLVGEGGLFSVHCPSGQAGAAARAPNRSQYPADLQRVIAFLQSLASAPSASVRLKQMLALTIQHVEVQQREHLRTAQRMVQLERHKRETEERLAKLGTLHRSVCLICAKGT